MPDPAQKSFEIRTARQYLEELLKPAYSDFLQDTLSSRKAVTCAIFAWHLRDWVWVENKRELQTFLGVQTRKAFDAHLFKTCPELVVIQELATGSKHFKGDGSAVKGSELGHGFWMGFGLFTQSHLVVKTQTGIQFAEHLFARAMSCWESLF